MGQSLSSKRKSVLLLGPRAIGDAIIAAQGLRPVIGPGTRLGVPSIGMMEIEPLLYEQSTKGKWVWMLYPTNRLTLQCEFRSGADYATTSALIYSLDVDSTGNMEEQTQLLEEVMKLESLSTVPVLICLHSKAAGKDDAENRTRVDALACRLGLVADYCTEANAGGMWLSAGETDQGREWCIQNTCEQTKNGLHNGIHSAVDGPDGLKWLTTKVPESERALLAGPHYTEISKLIIQ